MKKMSKRLHVALSLDDELYARFKAQEKYLHQTYEKYVKNPKRIWSVLIQDGKTLYRARILKAEVGPDGTVLTVSK